MSPTELDNRVVASALVIGVIIGATAGSLFGGNRQQAITYVSTALSGTSSTTTTTATTSISTTTTVTVAFTSVWTVTWYNFTQYGLFYLSADPTCVAGSSGGYYVQPPCYSDRADAFVFNCLSEAATQQGCTTTVLIEGSPRNYQGVPLNYTITLWYPFYNTTVGWPWNCKWSILPQPGTGYAYCVPANATAFIVSEPAPPPP